MPSGVATDETEESAMANLDVIPEERLSAESWERIFTAWCEANSAMEHCTVRLAGERLKALEDLWRAWRIVFSNRFGYDKTMPEAVKAMDRSDKSLVASGKEAEPVPTPPCCPSNACSQSDTDS